MNRHTTSLTDMERLIAGEIESDIPLEYQPFAAIARRVGTDEATVRNVIVRLKERGIIRRFGAVLRHQRAGVTGNALVVWAVPSEHIEAAGSLCAARSEITHCYERSPAFEKKYTLFTMVHGTTGTLEAIIKDVSSMIGINDYLVLTSNEEFKKESMRYFRP